MMRVELCLDGKLKSGHAKCNNVNKKVLGMLIDG